MSLPSHFFRKGRKAHALAKNGVEVVDGERRQDEVVVVGRSKGGIMGDDARKRTLLLCLSVCLSDGEEEDGRREER